MRITEVRPHLLSVREENDDPYMFNLGARSCCLLEIATDEGVTGVGETYTGLFAPEVARALVETYRLHLLGRDPLRLREIWEELYARSLWWGRAGFAISVIRGIDQALWELAGKIAGLPVYQLLGGLAKEKQRVYASCASSPWPLEKTVEMVSSYLSQGFNAVKFDLGYYPRLPQTTLEGFIDEERKIIARLRREVGSEVDFMVDAGQGFSARPWVAKAAMRVGGALDEFGLTFFEEPCAYTDLKGYAEVRRAVRTPIAGGESLTTEFEARDFLDAGAVDIAQRDAAHVGGISECRLVIALAAANHVPVSLHCYGLGVALAANAHVALADSNVCFLEFPARATTLRNELLKEPLRLEGGYLYPPSAPGLGVVLRPETLARYPFVPGTGFQDLFSIAEIRAVS